MTLTSKENPGNGGYQRMQWTRELVTKFWDGIAKTKLTTFNFSKQGGRGFLVLIDHLLNPSTKSEFKGDLVDEQNNESIGNQLKVLDFGAGDGDLIQFLCERGISTAAYEISEKRKQLLNDKLKGCSEFLGSVDSKTEQKFDVIIMTEVIEHILDEDMDSCLKTLGRLLNKNGFLIVTTPNNEDLELGMAYCPLSNTLFHRWQHVRSFTDLSLNELLSRYGFKGIVTHKVEFNDALYLPFDRIWGGAPTESCSKNSESTPPIKTETPSYLRNVWENLPTCIGSESNLLYIGQWE